MMTGEARMLETEAVVFSARAEQKSERYDSIENTSSETTQDKETKEIELKERFSKLKKSLRKRSISIL